VPVISGSRTSVTSNAGKISATITWQTDVPADSKVVYNVVGQDSKTQSDAALVTSHSVTLPDLAADSDYRALLASVDEFGGGSTCDAIAPGTDCTVSFITPANSGAAKALSVTATPDHIAKGEVSQLDITATDDPGAFPSDREVNFDIHNGNDRGTFSPNPARTGADGKVRVAFTAAKNGKAQVQVTVDTQSKNVDITVN
jgi:hypothetical protein